MIVPTSTLPDSNYFQLRYFLSFCPISLGSYVNFNLHHHLAGDRPSENTLLYGQPPPFLLGMRILWGYIMLNHIFVSTSYSLKFRFVELSEGILLFDIISFSLKKSLLVIFFFNKVIMSYVKRNNL